MNLDEITAWQKSSLGKFQTLVLKIVNVYLQKPGGTSYIQRRTRISTNTSEMWNKILFDSLSMRLLQSQTLLSRDISVTLYRTAWQSSLFINNSINCIGHVCAVNALSAKLSTSRFNTPS
jgi:hypothetical protein